MNQQNHGGRRSGSDIFDTFWNNAGLRGELFEGMDEEEARSDFISLVGNLSSTLYSFIEIK
jgi:hypothetical protein